jgi:hypothetical protein
MTTMSEQTKTQLLFEVLALFESFGVVSGSGADGRLMAKIQAAVAGSTPDSPPVLISFNPNQRMQCPLCNHPDFNECGCPADEQMAAMMS